VLIKAWHPSQYLDRLPQGVWMERSSVDDTIHLISFARHSLNNFPSSLGSILQSIECSSNLRCSWLNLNCGVTSLYAIKVDSPIRLWCFAQIQIRYSHWMGRSQWRNFAIFDAFYGVLRDSFRIGRVAEVICVYALLRMRVCSFCVRLRNIAFSSFWAKISL
jgi:hypothetical protein